MASDPRDNATLLEAVERVAAGGLTMAEFRELSLLADPFDPRADLDVEQCYRTAVRAVANGDTSPEALRRLHALQIVVGDPTDPAAVRPAAEAP